MESVILLDCIVGSYASMSENEGGLWTLQVTVREFDGLTVSVHCQVSQKLSLVSERWYDRPYWLLRPCYVLTTLTFVVNIRTIGRRKRNNSLAKFVTKDGM